jgi:hypothetical protein
MAHILSLCNRMLHPNTHKLHIQLGKNGTFLRVDKRSASVKNNALAYKGHYVKQLMTQKFTRI